MPSKSRAARVVIALPSQGRVHQRTIESIHRMIRSTTRVENIDLWWENAYPAGFCRNRMVHRFLSHPHATHMLLIDTDMVPPADGLDRLLAVDAPMVGGPAPICIQDKANARIPRLTTNVMDAEDPAQRGVALDPLGPAIPWQYRDLADLPDAPFTCDNTGLAFLLVRRDVFERMSAPWFHFVEHSDGTKLAVDVYFLRKARQLGFDLTIEPRAVCDHIKDIDLTHIDELLYGKPARRRWPATTDTIPRTVVLACETNHWTALPTAEVLLYWQERYRDRMCVHRERAMTPRDALYSFSQHPLFHARAWTHLLVLGPDVVPERDTLATLASIEAPLASALMRRMEGNHLTYAFSIRDPETGAVNAPVTLEAAAYERLQPVHSVDFACTLVRRDVIEAVPDAYRNTAERPDVERAFYARLCDPLRCAGHPPIVVPTTVTRWAEMGMLGLLHLREAMAARSSSAMDARTERTTVLMA